MVPPLHDWDSFYVIVGSSAAALTGLQFVVIALLSESRVAGGEEALHAFSTPTVVHFCAVLLIAAICSVPGQTDGSLAVCFLVTAIVALGYVAIVIARTRRQSAYQPVFEDWLWHAILPAVAYASLFIAAMFTWQSAAEALYAVAASALLLLFIGIHNAWDTAVFIASMRRQPPPDAD